ncbi:4734_t:CDS:2, partial [Racocetra fulgida]
KPPASSVTQDKESRSHKKKVAENIVQDVFDFTMDGSEKNHMTEILLTGRTIPRQRNNCQEKIESKGDLAELSSSDALISILKISDDQTDASEAVSAEVIESTSPIPVSHDFNSSSET